MNMVRTVLLGAIVATAFPAKGLAEGEYSHDGIFMRVGVGLGHMQAGRNWNISEVSQQTTLAIGGAISDNLLMYGELFGSAVPYDIIYRKLFTSYDPYATAEFDVDGAGLGVTYYFTPGNVYLAATLGLAANSAGATAWPLKEWLPGWGVNGRVGKEWWVSEDWSLGIAAQFLYTNGPAYEENPEGGPHVTRVHSMTFGMLLTASWFPEFIGGGG